MSHKEVYENFMDTLGKVSPSCENELLNLRRAERVLEIMSGLSDQ
jgi:hypothetical protein